MGKFKMPTAEQLLKKKISDVPKKDPVWVYLEQEMRVNVDQKPYNQKVGDWLKFLKDLKYHYHCESKRKLRRLRRETGPPWYVELSSPQKDALSRLKDAIHADVIDDTPVNTRQTLQDLGITIKFPTQQMSKAMHDSEEDPGLFIWNLYKYYYKKPPSKLRIRYDLNAMIMISSLVFIDKDECIKELENLTPKRPSPSVSKASKDSKVHRKYSEPNIQHGMYLGKMHVPLTSPHPLEPNQEKKEPTYDFTVKVRSDGSKERLRNDTNFLSKRKDRCTKEQEVEKVCTYKFWEPPPGLRATTKKEKAYYEKLAMVKKKAKRLHLKHKSSFGNVQFHLGTVAYTGGKARHVVHNVVISHTGYIPIHGGLVLFKNEYITNILGHWEYPKEEDDECHKTCNCLNKWESTAMDYMNESKCKCYHTFDHFVNGDEINLKEIYLHKPTKYDSYWIDKAKVFSMDPMEDYVKDTVARALRSASTSPASTKRTSDLPDKELLKSLLTDLTDTPLMVPHLPKAHLLNNLLEWVRKRKRGKVSPAQTKKWLLQSQRRWNQLDQISFTAPANRIKFTTKQLNNMDWSHRTMIQKLYKSQMDDFASRTRNKQVEQARLFWPTMKYDAYPKKAFIDAFFTYMPALPLAINVVNPYSSKNSAKSVGKTCPLRLEL